MATRYIRDGGDALILPPMIPAGLRVYVLSGIHGDAVLLAERIERITADMGRRGDRPTYLVLNGNLIGGADSADVILRAMRLGAPFREVAILRGPVETMLLAALEGDADAAADLPDMLLTRWGVTPRRLTATEGSERIALLREAVPASVHHWLLRRAATGRIGRYTLADGRLYDGSRTIEGDMIGLEGKARWRIEG
jgi:serine/threonine protein phosphatase 1